MANKEVLTGSKMLVGTGKGRLQILESKVGCRGQYWQEWGATLAPENHRKVLNEVKGDVIVQIKEPSGTNLMDNVKKFKQ